jgi:S1-C subfamily serine protease
MKRTFVSGLRPLAASAALALCLALGGAARANPEVYQQALHATAWIVAPTSDKETVIGTGAVIDAGRRLIVTNCHVVGGDEKVAVFFPAFKDGEAVNDPAYYIANKEKLMVVGRVVEKDAGRDLALVQVPRLPEGVKALPLAARSPAPGETVHAVGNSGFNVGALWRYSKGAVRVVYNANFEVGGRGEPSLKVRARVVETTLASNPGDSGGPTVNDKGELVGVTQSYDSRTRLVSISIDVNELRTVLGELEATPSGSRGPADGAGKAPAPRRDGPADAVPAPTRRSPPDLRKYRDGLMNG